MTAKAEVIISATDRTGNAINSARRGIDSLGAKAQSISGILSGLGVGMFAGALSGGAIAAMVKETADFDDAMGKLASRAGVTSEAMSKLAYAAKLSDVDNKELAKGLRELGKDAADGGEKLAGLGIKLTDASGKAKTSDELFSEVAERFSQMPDGIQKTNMAINLFGEKIGPQLIPLLNGGAAGIKSAADEASRFGQIVTEEAAAAAAEFNDNMTRLSTSIAGITRDLTGPLVAALASATTEFLRATQAGETFFGALERGIFGGRIGDRSNLVKAANDIEKLTAEKQKADKALAANPTDLQAQFRADALSADLAAATKNYLALADAAANPSTPVVPALAGVQPTGNGSGTKGKASVARAGRAPQDYDAILAERVAAAINNTDLVKAQELADTLAKLDQLAVAGLDPAIVKAVRDDLNGALGEAAKRYKEMADPLQKYREQLEEINALHQAGELTLEEAMAAEGEVRREIQRTTKAMKDKAAAMDGLGSTSKNIDTVITNAFSSAADAIAEFAMGGKVSFGDMVSSMIRDLIRLEMQMNMTKAYNAVGGMSGIGELIGGLFGNVTTAFKYNTNVGSQQTSMLAAQDAVFNAKGNVYRSPSLSAYSGQVYNSPQVFAFAKGAGIFAEAGPEAIMPLQRDSRGRLGVSAAGGGASLESVRVEIRNEGTPQEVTRAQPRFDAEGLIVEVFTRDIANEGPMAKSMQSRFGLSRAAGAFA